MGVQVDVQGRCRHHAVVEYKETAPPRVRVGYFNITGVARSNFKPGLDMNGRAAIINLNASVDVVNVSTSIDVAVVALRREYER